MNFKQWCTERNRIYDQEQLVQRAAEREWFLGDMVVKLRLWGPQPEGGPPPRVNVFVDLCRYQEGCTTSYGDGRDSSHLRDVYFEHAESHNQPLGVLSVDQIIRVAQCKAVFDAWVRGELEHLPDAAPDTIARAPLPGRPL